MVDNNNLTRINLPDIIILLYSGTGQTASLALTGPNGSYSAAIDMREGTTFDSDKVSYGNGRLTSTDATLAAVAFTSPTGIDGKEISGTLSLSYTETAVPVLGGTVAVSGTAQVGNALTADTSGLAATPAAELGALTYQWLRNGAAIPGATGATYSLVDADSGAMISVTVAAANCDGSVTSAAIGPVAAKPAAPEPPKAQEPTIPQTGDNVLPFAMAGSLAAFAIGVFCLMLLRRRIRHTV
jgi:hypothetical protein